MSKPNLNAGRPGRRASGGDSLQIGSAKTAAVPSNSTLRTTRKVSAPTPGMPKPQVSKSTVQILEEETQRMEERLKMLRGQMKTEKQHWETVKRTKDGTLWEAARPAVNYTEEVMQKIQKKNALRTTKQTAARPGSRPGTGRRSSNEDQLTQEVKVESPDQYTPSSVVNTSRVLTPRGTGRIRVGQVGASPSATRALLNEITSSSGTGTNEGAGSTWDGEFDEAENRKAFLEARAQWLNNGDEGEKAHSPKTLVPKSTSSTGTNFQEKELEAREYVHVTGFTPSKTESPSLLDGDFDENAAHAGFSEARRQWLAGSQSSSSQPYVAVAPEEPTPARESRGTIAGAKLHTVAVSAKAAEVVAAELATSKTGAIWFEGDFDEKESANAFAEARRDWLNEKPPVSNPLNMFSFAQTEVKTTPSALDLKYNISTSVPRSSNISQSLSSGLTSHEARSKNSCYQCYKLFYADKAVDFRDKKFCTQDCVRMFSLAAALKEKEKEKEKEREKSQQTVSQASTTPIDTARPLTGDERENDNNPNLNSHIESSVLHKSIAEFSRPRKQPAVEDLTNRKPDPRESIIEWQSSIVVRPATPAQAPLNASQSQPIVEFPDDD